MSPNDVMLESKLTEHENAFIQKQRNEINRLLNTQVPDKKLLVVGPCSIYQLDDLYEYALKLKDLSNKVKDVFHVVLRAYPEKSRTSIGWAGMATMPDGTTFDLVSGLKKTYECFKWLTSNEIPIASEMVNPAVYHAYSSYVSFGSIGARHVRSNIHRIDASRYDMPFGIKNPLCGDVSAAMDALEVIKRQNYFVSNKGNGLQGVLTQGNPNALLILRGSSEGPNFRCVHESLDLLNQRGLMPRVMVDCSHGNSGGDSSKQMNVFEQSLLSYGSCVNGFMLESFLHSGKSSIKEYTFGKSVTDSCLGFNQTSDLIMSMYELLQNECITC